MQIFTNPIDAEIEHVEANAAQLNNTIEATAGDLRAAEAAWLANVPNRAAWLRVERLERRLDELRQEDERTQWRLYAVCVARCHLP